jgi:hypothetical protein
MWVSRERPKATECLQALPSMCWPMQYWSYGWGIDPRALNVCRVLPTCRIPLQHEHAQRAERPLPVALGREAAGHLGHSIGR